MVKRSIDPPAPHPIGEVPLLQVHLAEIASRLRERRPVVFTDYDGTLTSIVEDGARAVLAGETREVLARLARRYTVAVVSGRDIAQVRALVQLDGLFYVGSHGFEIAGPHGGHTLLDQGAAWLPDLDRAEQALRVALAPIGTVAVERHRYALTVHHRRSSDGERARIETIVDEVLRAEPRLRGREGRKVFQLQPRTDWDKGRAVRWLLEHLPEDGVPPLPFYMGDDTTDEDAFRALGAGGVCIVVRGGAHATCAQYALEDPDAVRWFIDWLAGR